MRNFLGLVLDSSCWLCQPPPLTTLSVQERNMRRLTGGQILIVAPDAAVRP